MDMSCPHGSLRFSLNSFYIMYTTPTARNSLVRCAAELGVQLVTPYNSAFGVLSLNQKPNAKL